MTTLMLETEPVAIDLKSTAKELTVELADGRRLVVPLDWYPRLALGTPAERKHWRLLGKGYAIEWPDLDEHIGIEGLLAGQKSGESKKSFNRWLAARSVKAASSQSRKRISKHAPNSNLQRTRGIGARGD